MAEFVCIPLFATVFQHALVIARYPLRHIRQLAHKPEAQRSQPGCKTLASIERRTYQPTTEFDCYIKQCVGIDIGGHSIINLHARLCA